MKLIYIDPPYNTGKDFVYKDDYKDNLRNYQEITGQIDNQGNKLSTNTESDGRFHSNWLSMMYPRLILARNLLTKDGVIFVSIDYREVTNLKQLMDNVFGENSFIAIFKWKKTSTPPSLSHKVRNKFEFVLCYEKDSVPKKFKAGTSMGGDMPLLNNDNPISQLIIPKEKLEFKFNGLFKKGKIGRVELCNEIKVENGKSNLDVSLEGRFKWGQKNLDVEIDNGTTFIIKSEKFSVRYIKEGIRYKTPSDIISKEECGVGTNEDAGKEIESLFGVKLFSFPKPSSLIRYLFNFMDSSNDIFLDFFSGSSTSAHAILDLNREDDGNRRFIQVQFPEPTDPKSEVYKAGFKNIAEIGKERIRRVIKKIQKENPKKSKKLDLGFKVFKLDSSNIKCWDGDPDNLKQSLIDSVENIKEDRSQEDVLYEVLLKHGLDLSSPIEERIIEKVKVFSIGQGSLMVCLGDEITAKVAEGIGSWKDESNPDKCAVIFKDTGFTDVEKTNSIQTLKRFGIKKIRSI